MMVSFPRSGTQSDKVTLKGAKECVEAARKRIQEIIEDLVGTWELLGSSSWQPLRGWGRGLLPACPSGYCLEGQLGWLFPRRAVCTRSQSSFLLQKGGEETEGVSESTERPHSTHSIL